MKTATLYKICGIGVIIAAIVQAVVVISELWVSPYNVYGSHLSMNAPLHMAKYATGVLLLLSLPAVYVRQHERAGKLGFFGIFGLAFGFGLAAMPYTVLESTMDPSMSQQAAAEYLMKLESMNMAIPVLGMTGFPLFMLGLLAFAVATIRAKVLPSWTGWLSLASFVVGLLVDIGMSAFEGVIPHSPTYLMLGLLGYGYVLAAGRGALPAARTEQRTDLAGAVGQPAAGQ